MKLNPAMGGTVALLACVAALPGCHLLLAHQSAASDVSPATADRPSRDSAPGEEVRVEASAPTDLLPVDARPEAKPKPDVAKPKADTAKPEGSQPKPDTRPVYVNEEFTSGPGVVTSQTGTWSIESGSLRQPATDYNGYCATASVPVANYVAEAEVTVTAVKGVPSWAEGAGVGVRVQPGAVPPNPPGQYVCGISPDNGWLIVAKCPGGNDNNCVVQKYATATIPYQTPILVQATIIGSTFTCSLPAKGVSLTYVDTSYTSGGVSLITFYADASFGYLKVYAP